MFKPVYILYMLLMYIMINNAFANKNIMRSFLTSILLLNLVNLEIIRDVYSAKFVSVFVMEAVVIFISYVVLLLTYNMSKSEMKLAPLFEILVSVGLILLYAYAGSFLFV